MSEFSLSPLISLSECPNNAHHKEHISTIYNVRLASKYSMWKPCHDSLCGLSEPSQCQDRWGLGGGAEDSHLHVRIQGWVGCWGFTLTCQNARMDGGWGFTPTCQNARMGGGLRIHTYMSECKDGWVGGWGFTLTCQNARMGGVLGIHIYMSEYKDGWGAGDSHLHVRMQGWVGCWGDSHLHVRMQGWMGAEDSHLHVRMQGWMGAGDSHLHVRMQWWVGCWEFTLTCQNARMDGGGWWFSPTCQNARMGKVLGIHMYMSGWGLGIHT